MDELGEFGDASGVRERFRVHTAIAEDAVGEGVEEGEIALGPDGNVLVGSLCRLGGPRIDDDDLRGALVPHDALPEDGLGDAKIRTDEDDDITFLEVCVGGWRGIEAEGLLVGGGGGGHALAGIRIAMEEAHAKLEKTAKEGHFLEGDLASGEEGDGFVAMCGTDGLEALGEGGESGGPISRC